MEHIGKMLVRPYFKELVIMITANSNIMFGHPLNVGGIGYYGNSFNYLTMDGNEWVVYEG